MMTLIELYQNQINALCLKYHVKTLHIFGSALTDRFNEQSDVDMLVLFEQFDLSEYFNNYMGLKEDLENLMKRPVDIVEEQAIRNPIFRTVVDRDKKLVYERKSA
jgi:uncharacterized protein